MGFRFYKPLFFTRQKHVPLMEENPSQAIYTNIGGTKNLADLSCLYNVKKFVMISTDKVLILVMSRMQAAQRSMCNPCR
jgi:dTDP-D-glucose 4,6-dehydratase